MNKIGLPLKGASLFASAGIAEYYLRETGIDICVANELLPERARLYRHQYPDTDMICGNILDFLIACKITKFSTIGKE